MGVEKILSVAVQITGAIDPSVSKATQSVGSSLSNIDLKSAATKAAIVAGVAAVGTAAVEAGKYLFNLGSEFEEAYNTIRIGTGATGDALDDLEDSFKNVYSSIPTDMESASTAISDYNTRLGLTGTQLEDLSKQAIQVSDMLGEDLSSTVESSSKAFQAWNISADDMSDAMDYVFKVSQSTGAGFNELLGTVQSFAPQLQEMGYSFEDATALIGQLDKAGVNTSEVMSSMKKSVSTLASEGLSASEGIQVYSDKIKNAGDMTEATSIAAEIFGTKSASTMAAAIRNGTINVEDLTSAMEASGETISGAAEDTYTFSDKLQLLQQKAETAIEPLATKMVDLANQAIPYLTAAFDMIEPVIENIAAVAVPLLQNVFDAVSVIIPPIMQIIGLVGDAITVVAGALAPVISTIASALTSVLGGALSIVAGLFQGVIDTISSVVSFLTGTFGPAWSSVWNTARSIFNSVVSGLASAFKSPINAIINGINTFIRGLNKIKIPSWVPGVGGKGFNISTIPTLANGGEVQKIAIAGEAGTEAVINMNGNKEEAARTWIQAGNILESTKENVTNDYSRTNIYRGKNHSGFVSQATQIAGNNVVISFRENVHDQNVKYWQKAGQELGLLGNTNYFANGGTTRDLALLNGNNAVYYANGGFTGNIDFSKTNSSYFANGGIVRNIVFADGNSTSYFADGGLSEAYANVSSANVYSDEIKAATDDYNMIINLDVDITLPVSSDGGGTIVYEIGDITYAPNVTVEGDSFSDDSKEKLQKVLQEDKEEFYDMIKEVFRDMGIDEYGS